MAGEAGPEIMGHVNGKTEILNLSQMATVLHSAVSSAMISILGRPITIKLDDSTAAQLVAMMGVSYQSPAMAGGNVIPYEVARQIVEAIDSMNETIDFGVERLINELGTTREQLVAAIMASGRSGGGTTSSLSDRDVISKINRATRAQGKSVLIGY